MDTQERDKIIGLGRVLADEERRGCDDGAIAGGLEGFLAGWREAANGALAYPAVQQALAMLADYELQPVNARREVVARSLRELRGMFRQPTEAKGQEGGRQGARGKPL